MRARIQVAALARLIRTLHQERFGKFERVTDDEIRELLSKAIVARSLSFPVDFLFDEWSLVVDAWDIRERDSYLKLPRLGRKVRMPLARREAAWPVFEALRQDLTRLGKKTDAQLVHDVRESGDFPFTNVVIDEAQDISVPELRLLGAALGSSENGLFFAGDIGQRIFRAPFPWAATGVDIRGRSRSLKVNYRTSHQIRRQSDTLLPETLVEPDGTEENRLGLTSIFEGAPPRVSTFETRKDEIEAAAAWFESLLHSGIPADEIVCLVRTAELAEETAQHVSVPVLPMHEAKGAEYRAVAVIGLDQDLVPLEDRLLTATDEAQLDEVMNTERHLLYVAASRARDHLWMSGVEPVSEFLRDLLT